MWLVTARGPLCSGVCGGMGLTSELCWLEAGSGAGALMF